ncbi:protein SPMIP7 [Lissotriton helveticus]
MVLAPGPPVPEWRMSLPPTVDPHSTLALDRGSFLRQTGLPTERGPEDRHDYPSFQVGPDKTKVVRFNINATSDAGREHYSLAPLRDDAALLDPISGGLAPGGKVEVGYGQSTAVPSAEGGLRGRVKTAPPHCRAQSSIEEEREMLSHQGGKRWTSTSVSDAMLRARLGGWTSKEKVIPHRPHGPKNTLIQKISFDVDPALKDSPKAAAEKLKNELARKYLYTSTTHRAYGDVFWDNKLPPKITPPALTIDTPADPVWHSQMVEKYGSKQEMWQEIGGLWDRFQTRRPLKTIRPVTFISPCPRAHQIPLYTGSIGAENLEDIDNPNEKFFPFTIMRTPALYSNTSLKPNIPGYAGEVHWLATEPSNSNRHSASATICKQANGAGTWSPCYRYRHLGPFSRMITNVAPSNPFKDKEEARLCTQLTEGTDN